MRQQHIKWAAKLLTTRNFVVLTDTESVINLEGIDPQSFKDVLALTAQMRALKIFGSKIDSLVKEHQKRIAILNSGKRKEPHQKVKHITIT